MYSLPESLWTRIKNSLILAWQIMGGVLDSLIQLLESISKENREIAKLLDEEKMKEKERLKVSKIQTKLYWNKIPFSYLFYFEFKYNSNLLLA